MAKFKNRIERYRANAAANIKNRKDLINDFISATLSALADPIFTICAVISFVLIVTHIDDVRQGPLGTFLNKYPDNMYVNWAVDHIKKIFGLLILFPTCLRVKDKYRQFFVTGVLVLVFALKPLPVYSYTIMSTGLFYYISLKTPVGRMIALALLGWYLYPMVFQSAVSVTNSKSPGVVPQFSNVRVPSANTAAPAV